MNNKQNARMAEQMNPLMAYMGLLVFCVSVGFGYYVQYSRNMGSVTFDLSRFLVLPSWEMVRFQLMQLMQMKGGYFFTLWNYFVFISMTVQFIFYGYYLMKYILKDSINDLSKIEIVTVSWFIGNWIFSMVWFVLGLFSAINKIVADNLIFMMIIPIMCLFFMGKFSVKNAVTLVRQNIAFSFKSFYIALIGLYLLMWSTLMLFPQFYWDTFTINLTLPAFYASEGRFVVNPFHVYTYFSQNAEMIFTWAIAAEAPGACHLVVWGFFTCFVLFLYGWLRRIASVSVALFTVTILVTSAFSSWLVVYVKNDLQLGIFLFLQWWALLKGFQCFYTDDISYKRWIFLSGMFAGVACGFKFNATPSILMTFLGVILFVLKVDSRKLINTCGIFLAGVFSTWGAWIIRSVILTGNPVYPFLNKIFGIRDLMPGHSYTWTSYNLISLGWQGIGEYFRNLIQFKPTGQFSDNAIWLGTTGCLGISSLLCLGKPFHISIRWVTGIVFVSWMFSLLFAMKPQYHTGPLLFFFMGCFAISLNYIIQGLAVLKINFTRYFIFLFLGGFIIYSSYQVAPTLHVNNELLFSLPRLFNGMPVWGMASSLTNTTPNYAGVYDIEFMNYVYDKYAGKNDKALFVGGFRPHLLEHRHLWGFTMGQQPILYFAGEAKNAEQLKDILISNGFTDIILESKSWAAWINRDTPDGKHVVPIQKEDVEKVNEFMNYYVIEHFYVFSRDLVWYQIKNARDVTDPISEFDSEDVFRFPYQFLMLAEDYRIRGNVDSARNILSLYSGKPFLPEVEKYLNQLNGLVN